jgi:hypothetical protein
MKKILLVLILAVAANCVSAQDFKKVKIAVGILKWEDAKTEVDKLNFIIIRQESMLRFLRMLHYAQNIQMQVK